MNTREQAYGRRSWRRKKAISISIVAALLVIDMAETVHAIIGLPFTPLSYAGVARRTARRSVYWGGAAAAGAAVAGATLAALPPGCVTTIVNGISYNQCGGGYYRPYYEGTTVVYQQVEAP